MCLLRDCCQRLLPFTQGLYLTPAELDHHVTFSVHKFPRDAHHTHWLVFAGILHAAIQHCSPRQACSLSLISQKTHWLVCLWSNFLKFDRFQSLVLCKGKCDWCRFPLHTHIMIMVTVMIGSLWLVSLPITYTYHNKVFVIGVTLHYI